MKEMTRKEFLKLTGASTALLAMSHIIPTSAYQRAGSRNRSADLR